MTPTTRLRRAIERAPGYRELLGPGLGASLARGASTAFIIGVAARAITFPVSIALARWMGVDEFGAYTYVATWTGMLVFFTLLGLDTSLVRFVAAYRTAGDIGRLRGVLRRSAQLIVAMGALTAALTLLVVFLLRDRIDDPLLSTFVLACLFMPLAGLRMVPIVALRALRRIALSQGLAHLVQPPLMVLLAGVVVLTRGSMDSQTAVVVNGLAGLVVLGVGLWMLRSALPSEMGSATPVYQTREWMRVSLPLLLVGGIRLILPQTDIILVGLMLGPTEAGIYAVAARMAVFTSFGLVAANTIASPMIAEMYEAAERSGLQRLASLTIWGATLSALPIAALLIVFSTPLLGLFGDEFEAGSAVLMILSVALVIDALTGPIGGYLNMTGHQDANAAILTATALLNVVGNVVALQLWGMEGAALMTGASITFKNVWTWIVVQRRLGVNSSIFAPPPWR